MTAAVPTIRTVALVVLATVTAFCVEVDVGNFSFAVTGTPGLLPARDAVQADVGDEASGMAQMYAEAVQAMVICAPLGMAKGAAVVALVVSAPAALTMTPRYFSPATESSDRARTARATSRVMASLRRRV